MNPKTIRLLLLIASAGLMIAGLLFLCLSLFMAEDSHTNLFAALSCVVLANLFFLIRHFSRGRDQ